MKFRSQNNKRYKGYSNYIDHTKDQGKLRIVIIAAVFLILISIFWLTPIKSVVMHISGVLWSGQNKVENGLASVSAPLSSSQIRKENTELREKVFQSEIDNIKVKILEQQNADLKQSLLLSTDDQKETAIYAEITASRKQGSEDLLVIDKGTTQGIIKGDLVIYGGTVQIGKIIEVYSNSAIASLYSSFDILTPITVGSSTPAEARGKGLGSFEIRIPKGSTVQEGDLVRLRDHASSYALGTIGAVESADANPFQIAYFSFPVNPENMSYVAIIKGDEAPVEETE